MTTINTIRGYLGYAGNIDQPAFGRSLEGNQGGYKLTNEEKECYNKIVKDLSSYTTSFNKAASSLDSRTVFAIIFRQSESWKEIKDKFIVIANSYHTAYNQDWAKTWVADIRKIHNTQEDLQTMIKQHHMKQLKTDRRSNFLNEDAKNLSDLDKDNKLGLLNELDKAKITSKKQELKQFIIDLGIKLTNDLKNEELDNVVCGPILELLRNNWLSLTLFSEFPETIDMHETKLVAQVGTRPKDLTKLPLQCDKLINDSTKAIFIVEEQILESLSPTLDKINSSVLQLNVTKIAGSNPINIPPNKSNSPEYPSSFSSDSSSYSSNTSSPSSSPLSTSPVFPLPVRVSTPLRTSSSSIQVTKEYVQVTKDYIAPLSSDINLSSLPAENKKNFSFTNMEIIVQLALEHINRKLRDKDDHTRQSVVSETLDRYRNLVVNQMNPQ